ncbi:MAG: roadblock/LC7 domain-containing protein [Anaerolineae bacterium]|nr:roadblock/LC7 domain-containing protein [Anaerolineae bacterium]
MSAASHPEKNQNLNLRVGISIFPSQYSAIQDLISELKERCPAQFILLADSSGLSVLTHGSHGNTDLTVLGSLVAADMAASREIARATGQYKSYQLIMREGEKTSNFIAEAGEHLLLFVQVSFETPIGWARLLIRETCQQIAKIITTEPDLVDQLDLGLDDEKLNDAVGDALGSLWSGS